MAIKFSRIAIIVFLSGLCWLELRQMAQLAAPPRADLAVAAPAAKPAREIRYVAIGDSYSSGEGATPAEAWPALLAAHLTASGRPVTLVANPSVTGWTTQQAIDKELPVFKAARPDFATLLIGVNDYVQGASAETFRGRLRMVMDGMQAVLADKRRMLVVTIPDYSVTPGGAAYARGRDAGAGIRAFNAIITDEARKRGLTVVDIYGLSLEMGRDGSLVAADGLHPSAKEYALWETLIFPAAVKVLEEKPRLKPAAKAR